MSINPAEVVWDKQAEIDPSKVVWDTRKSREDDPIALIRGDRLPPPSPDPRLSSGYPDVPVITSKERFANQSIADQLRGGVSSSLNRTTIGLKNMIPGMETPDDARRAAQHADYVRSTGPASTAGSIATDVAITALPLSKVTTGLKAKTLLPLAGVNAAITPGTSRDRVEAGLASMAGVVAGSALSKTMQSLVPRAGGEALEKLSKHGIQPTIGQAAQTRHTVGNDMLTELENVASKIPLVGAGITRAKKYALAELEKALSGKIIQPETEAVRDLTTPILSRVAGLGRDKTLSAADIVRGTGSAKGIDVLGNVSADMQTGVATSMLALGAVIHTPLTVAVSAGLLAGYAKPVQQAMVATMKANDTIATWLARNPKFVSLVSSAVATNQNKK